MVELQSSVSSFDPTGDKINETQLQYFKMNSLLLCKALYNEKGQTGRSYNGEVKLA